MFGVQNLLFIFNLQETWNRNKDILKVIPVFNTSDTDYEKRSETRNKDDDEDEYEELLQEEIRLRKPAPGSKIADLTNIIEAQVKRNWVFAKNWNFLIPLTL